MDRKEILLCQLGELRNELLDAIDGVPASELAEGRAPGRTNPIGWIVCHCLRNWDHFLIKVQRKQGFLWDHNRAFDEYCWKKPRPGPPDLSRLSETVEALCSTAIGIIAGVEEDAFDLPAPHWGHENTESVAGNCVRVVNHTNAHLRQIWMVRGALGHTGAYPTQTLYKRPNAEGGKFHAPPRAQVLADRHRRD